MSTNDGLRWRASHGRSAQSEIVRSGGTQTRTFAYTGLDLTSATNPENGQVTYTDDGASRADEARDVPAVETTDAKQQQVHYTYDQ